MKADEKTSLSARCKSVARANTPPGVTVIYQNPLEYSVDFDSHKLVVPKPKTNVALYVFLGACFTYKFWMSYYGQPRYILAMAAHKWICAVMDAAGIEVSRKNIEQAKRTVGHLARFAQELGLKVDPTIALFARIQSGFRPDWHAQWQIRVTCTRKDRQSHWHASGLSET